MKVDTSKIAETLYNNDFESSHVLTSGLIVEAILGQIASELSALVAETLEKLEEMERPTPKTVVEYNERYGLDKGE